MKGQQDILQALDEFIRKYYKNLLIKGVLYAVGIVLTLFLAAVLLEHFGWLSSLARGLIFWVGIAAVAVVLAWFVVRPLLKMHGLGKRISHDEAARIIGKHFPEVSDKLLNLLQLMEGERLKVKGERCVDSDLLLAAVEQKTAQLRPVPFLNAIDLKGNRRYLKYALPPLAVLLVLLLVSPQTVTEPSKRIVNYNTVYERPAPFRFEIQQQDLSVWPGHDFQLDVKVDGEALPNEAFINVEGRRFKMSKVSPTLFQYTFKQVNRTQEFSLEAAGVVDGGHVLRMLPNPQVVSFRMVLAYPPYTGRKNETLVDIGDAVVPEGTVVRWLFQTRDADTLHFEVESGKWSVASDDNGRVEFSRRVMGNMEYGFSVSNGYAVLSDTLRYALSAITDALPMIAVEELVDSLHPDRRLFRGRIKDDYGFSKLVFVHKTTNAADTTRNAVSEAEIGLNGEASQEFYFSFNTAELVLAPGDELNYWFEVSDNDAIHGPKTARSQVFEIKIPTADELDQMLAQSSTEVRQSADAQMSELQKLQEEINEMMKKLVDKKELNWQDKKDLEQIAEKQKQVKAMMQQMQKQIQA